MSNYYIPIAKFKPFIQYLEDEGYDINNMPDMIIEEQWLEFTQEQTRKRNTSLYPNQEEEQVL